LETAEVVVTTGYEIGLDVRVRLQVRAPQPVHAGNQLEVLPVQGTDSTDRHQADQNNHGKDQNRGHLEGRMKVIHLGKERERDDGAGEDRQEHADPAERLHVCE
jgi:hypothetical protein